MTDLTKLTDAELIVTLKQRVDEACNNLHRHGGLNDPFAVKQTLGEVWDRVSTKGTGRGIAYHTIVKTMAEMNAEQREDARHIALSLREAFTPNPWKEALSGRRVSGVTYPAKRSIRNP